MAVFVVAVVVLYWTMWHGSTEEARPGAAAEDDTDHQEDNLERLIIEGKLIVVFGAIDCAACRASN